MTGKRCARTVIASTLAWAIVLLSPGLSAYQAFAASFERGAPEGIPSVPAAPAPVVPSIPALGVGVPGVAPPVAPVAGTVPSIEQAAVPALPASPVSPAAVPAPAVPAAQAKASPLQAIRSAVAKLTGASSADGKAQAVANLYGEKAAAADRGSVDASGGSSGQQPSGLQELSVSDLQSTALDKKLPSSDRQAAIKALARKGGPEAMAALEKIGAYDPQASAADYEVIRQSLRALSGLGKDVSLPAVSQAHAEQILSGLRTRKASFAAFDYDGTLEESGKPVSADTAKALSDLGRSGVETMILTDRAEVSRGAGDAGVFDSLAPMSAADKLWIDVASNRGAQVWRFDAAGERVAVSREPEWTDSEREQLDAIRRAFAAEGYADESRPSVGSGYDYAIYPKAGLSSARLLAGMERLKKAADGRFSVTLRHVDEPAKAFYTLSKFDKSLGVSELRKGETLLGRLRSAERLPAPLRGIARAAAATLPSRAAAADGLLVGDHFFGPNAIDSDMIKGAPGALAVAVGGAADAKLDNVFVWPAKGHEASMELARAAATGARAGEPAPKADDPINTKTLTALVLQRLPSMAAYMLVTIAFVNVAVPIVGWTGYGILMSLSPMAGIAAANIMANAIKNKDARGAMALNTMLRVFSLMALPTFHFFGILNVGTLVLGALAEGFLLSSILTTEGSFLKVLFPAKQLGNINGALFMMFPGVQVVLGLFLGIGRYADKLSPFTIFAGAAAVNLLLVLPLILWGIPRVKLSGASSAPARPKTPLSETLKKNWKQVALFVAAVGVFAGLTFGVPALPALGASMHWGWPAAVAAFFKTHQGLTAPLPIVGALVYWIASSDAFKALKSGQTAQASDAEKALRAERAQAEASGSADAVAAADAKLKPYEGRQLRSVLLMAASTLLYYPLYLVAAPHVAELLAGAQGKSQLTGEFLGALFFGSLISTSARTKLPEVASFNFRGKRVSVGAHQLVQLGVAALAGFWVAGFAASLPVSIGLGLAAAAAAMGLMYLTSRVTDRGWVQLIGVGAATLLLPFAVWSWPALLPFLTIKTAMFASLLAVGLFNGPNFVSLITYMYKNTAAAESSRVQGIQGALFNAAISVGYALLTIASGFLNPAYPAVLAILGAVAVALGLVFWRAPKGLPGLSDRILEPRRKAQTPPGGSK